MPSHNPRAQAPTRSLPRFVIRDHSQLRSLCAAVAMTGFIALCAHVSFALPLTPVPVTMQTLAVIMAGILFGPSGGASILALYLFEGAVGMPVFSPQGTGGLLQLAGPSAGYLLSYPMAACCAGFAFSRVTRKFPIFVSALIAGLSAELVIFVCGPAWIVRLLHIDITTAVVQGVVPFLPGELAKLLLVATAITMMKASRNSESLDS